MSWTLFLPGNYISVSTLDNIKHKESNSYMKIWWTLFTLASGLFFQLDRYKSAFFWPLNDLEQLTTENKSGFFYRQGGPYATETDLNARDSHESRLHCT